MTFPQRISPALLLTLTLADIGCNSQESDLEQQARACENLCEQTLDECSGDPAFGATWQLECEVSCNLDFGNEAMPVDSCIEAATDCAAKDACLGGGPPTTLSAGTGEDSAADDATDPATDPTDDPSDDDTTEPSDGSSGSDDAADESTGAEIIGHACCDTSGTPCADPEVRDCTCQYMGSCCSNWEPACAAIAVANGCLDGGCSTLDGQDQWQCSCSTYDVYCPDDPFVSQLIFGTDACGLDQGGAMAIAEAACEQGSADCMVGAGSCECTCENYGDTCGPKG